MIRNAQPDQTEFGKERRKFSKIGSESNQKAKAREKGEKAKGSKPKETLACEMLKWRALKYLALTGAVVTGSANTDPTAGIRTTAQREENLTVNAETK